MNILSASRRVLHPSSGIGGQVSKAAASRVTGGVGALRSYHENIVEHYENPRNVGSLDKNDTHVGTETTFPPRYHQFIFTDRFAHLDNLPFDPFQIHRDSSEHLPAVDDDGIITETKFKTFGCGSAIASSSLATEWLKGRSVSESLSIKNTDIASHLKLPPVKLHCSMLAEDAIKAAIKDLQEKGTVAEDAKL